MDAEKENSRAASECQCFMVVFPTGVTDGGTLVARLNVQKHKPAVLSLLSPPSLPPSLHTDQVPTSASLTRPEPEAEPRMVSTIQGVHDRLEITDARSNSSKLLCVVGACKGHQQNAKET